MGIKSWEECWYEETKNRESININNICTFGVKLLDDALIGMLKNDFIIIGADSGVGKSELSLDIALHNVSQGRRVGLYFIEGGPREAIARIKWKLIKNNYYVNRHTGVDMDYRKWRMNMIKDPILIKIQDQCLIELKEKINDNLQLACFNGTFSIDDLIESLGYFLKPQGDPLDLMDYKHEVDLIIIDHLQYFTLLNPKDEYGETSNILKKINEITHFHEIPVILISHLRKKDKDRGLPSQEDFFGTSNIAKISTQAIMISPDYGFDDHKGEIYPTFFRFVKSRTGLKSNIAIRCNFNLKKGRYEDNYEIYKIVQNKISDKPLPFEKLPKWAKDVKNVNLIDGWEE